MPITELLEPIRRETDRGRVAGRLGAIKAATFDVNMPHSRLMWHADGSVGVWPSEPVLTPDGVWMGADATVTRTAVRQACERVRMPLSFYDRLHPDFPALAARNLNTIQAGDDRPALLRFLRDGDEYVLRAILSDRYAATDNLDVLQAVIAGMTGVGASLTDCEVDADWTADRFRLRIAIPQIAVAVPDLLADYRPPYSMLPGRDVHARPDEGERVPMLWAGIEVTNSETGGGAMTVAPRAVIQVCRNGLTRTVDVVRRVHVGQRLDEGVVSWSSETRRRALELVTSQVTDAVGTFASEGYLEHVVAQMRAAKGVPVLSASAAVEEVVKVCGLTEAEGRTVLDLFASSGDHSALGLGNAVTAAAQHAESGDRQAEIEETFWQIVGRPRLFAEASS